ncbi:urotensin-related peptide 1 isoform X2 [Cynoglossus semilaevis]|uniref:urotensin-related peptide 1 isoform X2 n=1 Tax=Cynoglossus semilaevis TaxID=244447 RepID=UPI000D624CC5|nr:uncharacterized protein LOC112488176 isoform X2 [Cynoglossus semilaevis]
MDVFCRYISEDRSASSKNSPNLAVTMLSFALFYLVAVACSGRWTQALPLFPDTDLEPPADLIHNLVSEVEDNTAEAQRRNDMFPLLMQQTGTRNSWSSKGNRFFPPTYICHIYHFRNIPYIFFSLETEDSDQAKTANMMENLKDIVLKLAAADQLRSHSFLRSAQNLPKTNKRACFWKYCVTN